MGSLARADPRPRAETVGPARGAAAAPGEHLAREAEASAFAREVVAERRPGSAMPPPAPPAEGVLPARDRAYFEARLGAPLPSLRLRRDPSAQAEAGALGAKAFTRGREIAFAAGAPRQGTAAGLGLLAHEVAHAAQQASGRAPVAPQRVPDGGDAAAPPTTEEESADAARDAQIAEALGVLTDSPGAMFIEEAGGLVALERRFPRSAAIILPRLRTRFGAATVAGLREHDATIMHIIANAAVIRDHVDRLLDRFRDEDKDYAWDFLWEIRPGYDLDYADVAGAFVEHGPMTLVIDSLTTNEPELAAREIEREALRLQADRESQVAEGRALVGTTIGTRDVLMWFDDTITLRSLLTPEWGEASQDAALLRARIAGSATAVIERAGRHYVYALNEDYDLDDALASGFDRRTELIREPAAPRAIIVTSDGVVLRRRESRYFVEENVGQEERLNADLSFLEDNRDELGFDQIFTIFRELLRDAIFANLERSRATLARQRGSLFQGGIAHFSTMDRRAAEGLQRDTAALRSHMLEVSRLAHTDERDLSTEDRLRLETHLLAIGLIHTRSPMAVVFVTNNRDPDSDDPPEAGDFEDRLAGEGWGDVVFKAVGEIDERLTNIETVRNYLLHHPDAALDFEPLHDVLLTNFTQGERLYIDVRLIGHTLSRLASAVGMVVRDLALLGLGTLIGGPIGLTIAAVPVASGIKGTADAFEHAHVMQAMTQLDLTGEFAMATPEMAASARRWAWISLGLTLVDMAGFAAGARASARLASVMASKDVEAVLRFNRATMAEAAERLGMREQELVRQLSRATGPERAALLNRMRSALTPAQAGGRAGFWGWDEALSTAELTDMRSALLARTDDVPAVTQAVRGLGYAIDDTLIATIKRYNFDSPGIAFTRENYEAWSRLAAGRGTIGDVRYIIHEAEEVGRLQAVQRRTGFDFLGENWDRLAPVQRARWRNQFSHTSAIYATDAVTDDVFIRSGHYISAHGHALEREFQFVAEQAYRLSGGRVRLTGVEAAAVDITASGREAREFVVRDGLPLAMHGDIARWQARASEVVPLSPEIRAALGERGIRNAMAETGRTGLMRGFDIAEGAEPTLTEFLALIRRLPADF